MIHWSLECSIFGTPNSLYVMDVPNQVEGNSMRMWHSKAKPTRLWLSYMQSQISKHPIPRSYSTHPRNHRLAKDWKVYIYIWNHRTPIYIIILYIPYIRICPFSWLNPPKKMLKFPIASLSNDSGPQSADNDFGLLQRCTPEASLGSCHGVSTAAICFMLYDHGKPINWNHTSVLSQSLKEYLLYGEIYNTSPFSTRTNRTTCRRHPRELKSQFQWYYPRVAFHHTVQCPDTKTATVVKVEVLKHCSENVRKTWRHSTS